MLREPAEDRQLPLTRGFEMISEQTMTVLSNTITFANLDMNRDRFYRLIFDIDNAHGAAIFIGLYFNGDFVHANYRHNDHWSRGGVTGGLNNNQPRCAYMALNDECSMIIDIVQYYGSRYGYIGKGFSRTGGNLTCDWFMGYYLPVTANITQIDLRSLDLANVLQLGISIGDNARLFRYYMP